MALIHGTLEPDRAFAAALERAATKFGAEIVETREYEYVSPRGAPTAAHPDPEPDPGADPGCAGARRRRRGRRERRVRRVPAVPDLGPAAGGGTQGLILSAWHRSQEQWGATQVQRRFEKFSGRWMTERDYTAWLTVRILGEAVTRTSSADPQTIVTICAATPSRSPRSRARR